MKQEYSVTVVMDKFILKSFFSHLRGLGFESDLCQDVVYSEACPDMTLSHYKGHNNPAVITSVSGKEL